MRAITRKQFLSLLARTGAVAAAAPLIAACGGDDSGDGDGNGNGDGTGGPDGGGGGGGGPDGGGGGGGGPDGGGGGGPDGGENPADCSNGTTTTISANHGHTLVVPVEDVEVGVEKTYDITGTSGHPHTVTVTAAHFAMLQQGQSVTITSSIDAAHSHQVTIACA